MTVKNKRIRKHYTKGHCLRAEPKAARLQILSQNEEISFACIDFAASDMRVRTINGQAVVDDEQRLVALLPEACQQDKELVYLVSHYQSEYYSQATQWWDGLNPMHMSAPSEDTWRHPPKFPPAQARPEVHGRQQATFAMATLRTRKE